MKEYHEVACIKDGNKIDGFLLASESYKVDDELTFSHVDYFSLDDVKRLAKSDLVQYFIYNEKLDRLEISYIEEELNLLRKIGTNDVFISQTSTLSDYLRNDIIIKKTHFELAKTGKYFCGSIHAVQKLPLMPEIIYIQVFGNMNNLRFICENTNNIYLKSFYKPENIFDNIGTICIPAGNYLEITKELPLLLDTSLVYRDDMIKGMKGSVKRAVLNKVIVSGENLKDIIKMIELKNNQLLNEAGNI